ncbi:GPR endopeptidase [Natribacillus halophilus]|uniref:Germination protease n=1 Tax=Natribacillus halophilus TaxID=549003 RepID=A0A1G8JVD8_9BACI|nr:GPR endopeptidase [Natribacillus halophilus]SDI34560.1 GPR endopeptidase Aspartic peptidase. MEROPS family A25 [Natribacillus halophilus]
MDEQRFQPRSDLAVEDENVLPNQDKTGIDVQEREVDDITIVHVDIDEQGAEYSGRLPGKYLTLETLGIREKDTNMQARLIRILSEELISFLQASGVDENSSGLVIGLGNRDVTPDALGPKAVEQLVVTRHLFELGRIQNEDGYRDISAISPGVMGVTGIETSEILHGIVEKTNPDFVIAIDALAARSIERVNATIQISDTGIHPGSGVQNARKQLNEKELGVPVIAIGIPTVVDAVSITSDTIDFLFKHFGREVKDRKKPANALTPAGMTFGERKKLNEEDLPDEQDRQKYFGIVGTLEDEDKRKLIQEVLSPLGHNLMVTPKEVDTFMEDMANVIAEALNITFHKAVTIDSSGHYTR